MMALDLSRWPDPKTGRLLPFGRTLPGVPLVPSSWFPTTSTASSAPGLRACCIPQPAMGFIAFGARQLPACLGRIRRLPCSGRLPRDDRPFGAFPSSAAGPCHHGLLPSCRYRSVLASPHPEVRATSIDVSSTLTVPVLTSLHRSSLLGRSSDAPGFLGGQVSGDEHPQHRLGLYRASGDMSHLQLGATRTTPLSTRPWRPPPPRLTWDVHRDPVLQGFRCSSPCGPSAVVMTAARSAPVPRH